MSGICWLDVERQFKNSNEKPIVRSLFRHRFELFGAQCFRNALSLLCECREALSNRSVSLACLLLDELESFASTRYPNPRQLLTLELKHEAVSIAVDFKNVALTGKLCRIFCVSDDKMAFVPLINDLLSKRNYTEACTFVIALDLQRQYSLEDIVIPLIFQDKANLVEVYVRQCPDLQLELVKYLDLLSVGTADACNQIIRRLYLSDVRMSMLKPKTIGKLVSRFIKMFDIPPEVCPNLITYRSIGALKYLITRKYIEGRSNDESWDELVQSTVGRNELLMHELLTELVCANEPREALRWARFYELPFDDWPDALKSYHQEDDRDQAQDRERNAVASAFVKTDGESSSCVNWDGERPCTFHVFPLALGGIRLVDNVEEYLSCMETIVTNYDLVGIDGEWKPMFGLSASKIALLQLAVRDMVFLLDMMALLECLNSQQWNLLVDGILANPRLRKLGYGFTSDLDMLRKALPSSAREGLKGVKKIVDLERFCDKMNVLHPELVSQVDGQSTIHLDSKGLSQLTNNVLGHPLDKTEQFSDWERRPLRQSQIIYAALDAYCLLQIYDALCNKALTLNLDFDSLLVEMKPPSTTKNKKTTSKVQVTNSAGASCKEFPGFDASDFKVVVDNMLQGLGHHLRLCGVDAVILENDDDHDSCAKIAQRENRFILSSGTPYQMLKGHMPDGMCLNIPCGISAVEQTELVFKRYNIRVTQADIFSRCTESKEERTGHSKKKKPEYIPFPTPPPSKEDNEHGKIVWAVPEGYLTQQNDDDDIYPDSDDDLFMFSH